MLYSFEESLHDVFGAAVGPVGESRSEPLSVILRDVGEVVTGGYCLGLCGGIHYVVLRMLNCVLEDGHCARKTGLLFIGVLQDS
jgi:hypothetical protein